MTDLDILRQRFYNQHLTGAGLKAPEDVVRWLGAVQSQDYAGAKWSVGQRVEHATDAGVDEAFANGKILRTHVLRPTWHFVTPADIRWMLQLTAPRVHALNAFYYRKLELDQAVLTRAHMLFTQALQGDKQLARLELASVLRDAGIVADKLRLAYIMMHAELEGLICSGAVRGKQHTYALLEERVPPAKPLPHDEALAELARRFFASHGPATLKEYIRWSGLSAADAQASLTLIKQQLEHVVVDDQTHWLSATMPPAPDEPMVAYLLPEYDECVLTYKSITMPDLPWTISPDAWKDIWYRPVIIDYKRAGTWRRTPTKSAIVVETNLFATLDPVQTQLLEEAVARYGVFMATPASIKMATA